MKKKIEFIYISNKILAMIKLDIIQIEDLIDKRAEELAKNSYNKF